MDSARLIHHTTEIIYDLFGIVFFVFFFVTLVAFRRPLLTYCAASYIVASALWIMTTIFNLGYMLPHLLWSVCRLQHPNVAGLLLGTGTAELTPEQQQAAMMVFMPKSVLSLRAKLSGAITPPIVNEDLIVGADTGMSSAVAGFRHHSAAGGEGGLDIVSSGVAGCLTIMVLVCVCSALLVAVSVGMVLEANVLEQKKREEDGSAGGVASPVMVADAIRNARMVERNVTGSTTQHPRVLRLAMWVNRFVGIDELRYTNMYPASREGLLLSGPGIRGNLLFFMPRACTRLFLGPSAEVIWARPARSGSSDAEAAMSRSFFAGEKL